MKIESLNIYPLKSAKGCDVSSIFVDKLGFEYDRYYAICNSNNKILTARELPSLLNIKAFIDEEALFLNFKGMSNQISIHEEIEDIELSLFKEPAFGKVVNHELNEWLSKILGIDCKLVKIDQNNLRKKNEENIAFSDLSPIHLVSKESIDLLNQHLEEEVEIDRFRANIVISGIDAFEENKINKISIGDCEFKMTSKTKRCSLITINPDTGIKSKTQEPLRTLAQKFKSSGKVEMGIYLEPTKIGKINSTDKINIEYC
ncbi:MOSC domain-containing protein [Aureibacter tunicatorum]|uniref:MOSC domain-containing protein n=1 Tax=Aureibacter tunicatorum TaxID=866807 RepID=A0AAE3XSA5_9BACT|nr:MOSC N-terminal beta barrel domain-containing protein [Aureibacter tunicatorum]MDR6241178.1 hypothetical protein [Aureibacter tunicatorum]BDD03953.1 hypothetical protein AUTU_14360 [Aureibacter tunicatorum]